MRLLLLTNGAIMNMDQLANAPFDIRTEAFEKAAELVDQDPKIVEKDYFLCWAMKMLLFLTIYGSYLTFKGGSSLSKAYDIIKRLSEDLDMTLDRALLGFGGDNDPAHPGLSNKKRKRLLEDLQDAARNFVSGPLLAEALKVFNANLKHEFALEVDPSDGQTLLFQYPTAVTYEGSYIKPVIKFEFGARGVQSPVENRTISPYIHQAYPDLKGFEGFQVKTLGIERTFWEKATVLHKLYHMDPAKPVAHRMSRHLYDFAMMLRRGVKERALAKKGMLDDVAHDNNVFFRAAWASYDTAKPGSLRLSPHPDLAEALLKDYADSREMYYMGQPNFHELLRTIASFEAEINAVPNPPEPGMMPEPPKSGRKPDPAKPRPDLDPEPDDLPSPEM